jgi:hypothetical protein
MAGFEFIFVTLALLFVKHWYIDFVDQSIEEVNHKGLYGRWPGVRHSLKQGFGTLLMLLVVGVGVWVAVFMALIDFIVHYHVDWAKMNWGNRDMQDPQFWSHLGLDQLAHYLTYLVIVWAVLS